MNIHIINTNGSTKEDVLLEIACYAEKQNLSTSSPRLFKAFLAREKESTTAFENGIAIPHARIKEIVQSAIVIARNNKNIEWKSLDNKPTTCAIALIIKGGDNVGNEHMEALGAVSSLLLTPKNVEIFKSGKIEEVQKLINGKATQKNINQSQKNEYYDLIAVTACPTGVAHTNMAAEAIERYAKENNLKVKVERQAGIGTINPLSQEDVAKSKYVLLAIGRTIEGMERFNGKQLLKVGVAMPLKDMNKLWQDVKKAPVFSSGNKTQQVSIYGGSGGAANNVSIMAALMTGLSYMIPIVIAGGIFLAFGLGIGRLALGDVDVTTKPGTIWYTIFQIGVAGINLAVVVLGGFLAQAIGGRQALAPALLLSFICQGIGMGDTNYTFFNYENIDFGVKGSNLSFFGSIAAGFLCGYGAKYWGIYISTKIPKSLKTIEPIMIVPILFVLVGWILFAFLFYLPLYYLSVGLNDAIDGLVKNNLMWIAGIIGGAMLCFDLGGPVNKIAFGTGVALIASNKPQFMGAIAAAGSVGPAGMATGYLICAHVFRLKKFREDTMLKDSVVPGYFMALVGISEGAIPFTLKNPKTAIYSNVIGGAIAGGISGAFLISDTAAHTGPIVYILGAIGKNGLTDYAYGLLYIMAFVIGSLATAIIFALSELLFVKHYTNKSGNKIEIDIKNTSKNSGLTQAKMVLENNASISPSLQRIRDLNKLWNGYAWKQMNK